MLKDYQNTNTQIEWTRIIWFMHFLIHEYVELDYELIWKIITEYIPSLIREF
jgi:uncharacterized protein with HEPN domain